MIEMEESSERRFKFLEHTTDAEIEAYGRTLEEAFENAALATEETMVSLSSINGASQIDVNVEAKDLESLLYAWLEELISLQDTDGMLFSRFSCKISKRKEDFELKATCFGEKYDPAKHEQKTAIKAPTYHDMKIFQEKDRVSMRFLLDL
ncbi:MAG: archease [Nitrososphaerota archaeon]|nr:archease [Nitrososphaerota archaeon]